MGALTLLSLPASALAATNGGHATHRAAALRQAHGSAAGGIAISVDMKANRLTLIPQPSERVVYNAAGKIVSRATVPAHGNRITLQGYRANTAQGRRLLAPAAAKGPGAVPQQASANCTPTGEGASSSNVVAYPATDLTAADMFGSSPVGDLTGEYIWNMAVFEDARLTTSGLTTDWDSCANGGWKSNNGYYLDYSGVGFVFEVDLINSNNTIGPPLDALYLAEPGLGSSGAVTSTITLSAQYGPISVGASLPATAGGTYTGLSGAAQSSINPSSQNPWSANISDAWWQANSAVVEGTSSPVNDTNDVIWELPNSTPQYYVEGSSGGPYWFDSGYTYSCPNIFFCG